MVFNSLSKHQIISIYLGFGFWFLVFLMESGTSVELYKLSLSAQWFNRNNSFYIWLGDWAFFIFLMLFHSCIDWHGSIWNELYKVNEPQNLPKLIKILTVSLEAEDASWGMCSDYLLYIAKVARKGKCQGQLGFNVMLGTRWLSNLTLSADSPPSVRLLI